MATTKEDVLEFISNMSVLELSELVKEFEEKFGVSAQATVVAGGGAAALRQVGCGDLGDRSRARPRRGDHHARGRPARGAGARTGQVDASHAQG